ncbi:DUF4397 domain-containing protein [Microbacterium yannicii]|uniref:DUF4397 domain-containing protein n=1 Tax=Microbacterium yannicii TaxID=671622 RepID=UPI0002DB2CE3|nr:DUF4397 domain-containing protein [Microbacterium yannicii]
MKNLRQRVPVLIVAVAASVVIATPSAAVGASAEASSRSAPTEVDGSGWLRIGHLSPDTKAVDVRLTALSGGSVVLELSDVSYGNVSPYQTLPQGTYTVSMIPAGSGDWDQVAISDTVEVSASTASTVAAYGPTASLQLRAFDDDLTGPSAGNGRIRLIQASTVSAAVDVQTSTGLTIAEKARPGTATAYTDVPAGAWDLSLSGPGGTGTATVDVPVGSVSTLFILDTADGGLTILPVLDSAGAGVVPIGGVDTGGGWLAGSTVGESPRPGPIRVGSVAV